MNGLSKVAMEQAVLGAAMNSSEQRLVRALLAVPKLRVGEDGVQIFHVSRTTPNSGGCCFLVLMFQRQVRQ